MTIEEVVKLLGQPWRKEPTADGGEVWRWQQNTIRGIWRGRCSTTFMNVVVDFWHGTVSSVHLEYRLVSRLHVSTPQPSPDHA